MSHCDEVTPPDVEVAEVLERPARWRCGVIRVEGLTGGGVADRDRVVEVGQPRVEDPGDTRHRADDLDEDFRVAGVVSEVG